MRFAVGMGCPKSCSQGGTVCVLEALDLTAEDIGDDARNLRVFAATSGESNPFRGDADSLCLVVERDHLGLDHGAAVRCGVVLVEAADTSEQTVR